MASSRITWLTHSGTQILCVDLRSSNWQDQLAALEGYVDGLRQAPAGGLNVMVLGDSEVAFHPDINTRTKHVMANQTNQVRRSALVGFSGISRVAFDGFFSAWRMMGGETQDRGRHFEASEQDAALDWLAAP